MAPEPNNRSTRLLKASAQARRAEFGADPQMPNPMRARLHDEIARLNRADEAQPRRSWLAMFWPQISIATAVAAVLVTGAVMWLGHKSLPERPAMQLAINDVRSPESTASLPADALRSLDLQAQAASKPAPVTPEDSIFRGGMIADNKSASQPAESEAGLAATANEIQKFAEVTVAAAPPAAALERRAREEEDASRVDKPAPEVASAMTAPAQTFAAKAGAAAGADRAKEETAKNANLQQQFSQTTRGQTLRNNVNVKQSVNILENFQVEQNGREIRVVDADGSTYVGKFEPVAQSPGEPNVQNERCRAGPCGRSRAQRWNEIGSSAERTVLPRQRVQRQLEEARRL